MVRARDVSKAVREHVHSDERNEVGGVLIGELVSGRAHVRHALPALEAVGGAAQLTFTHDVWEQILNAVDNQYPDEQIVGWYHSHPGHGIFLSSYDQFIHENFFSAPGMLALVVDPQDDDAFGWFGWDAGTLVRIGSDLPVDRPDRAEMPREIATARLDEELAASAMDGVRRTALLAIASVLLFAAGSYFGSRPVKAELEAVRANRAAALAQLESRSLALLGELCSTIRASNAALSVSEAEESVSEADQFAAETASDDDQPMDIQASPASDEPEGTSTARSSAPTGTDGISPRDAWNRDGAVQICDTYAPQTSAPDESPRDLEQSESQVSPDVGADGASDATPSPSPRP